MRLHSHLGDDHRVPFGFLVVQFVKGVQDGAHVGRGVQLKVQRSLESPAPASLAGA